jgi:hypothetical protein
MSETLDEAVAKSEASAAFEREVGVSGLRSNISEVGNRSFLKFVVGRQSPLYTYALHASQQNLSQSNPFRGALGISVERPLHFPGSTEANALLTLLTRSTRAVSQDTSPQGFVVPYVPFQKGEDHLLAQPASHIVRGRRGVGKSTLIRRAVEILSETGAVVAVLDMQTYSTLEGSELIFEVLQDVCDSLIESAHRLDGGIDSCSELLSVAEKIRSREITSDAAPVAIKRALAKVTRGLGRNAFVFLDDFHLIDDASQPILLHAVHAALKGANGWLKVAGLASLLHTYTPKLRKGLQIPGDAQFISLDLTLENPEAAERHLKAILTSFLDAVGYPLSRDVIPESALRRLVWANAGVPRDFLQMFGRSLEHAQRNKHAAVTLSDVNIAIGEFGQQKMDDVERDARNEAGDLLKMLKALEDLCLEKRKINGFLLRTEDSRERVLVQILSDLRMVHLIHQSITPHKAGERFEAYILDYSLFTGFRRRPNISEMVPEEFQFKASELRALPRVYAGLIDGTPEETGTGD